MNSSIFIVQFKEIFNEIRWEISEKKKRGGDVMVIIREKNGYRSTRGDSNKFSLHFYNMRKNFKIRETW